MSNLVLPTPLASSSIALGQLITDPIHSGSTTSKQTSQPDQGDNTYELLPNLSSSFDTLRSDASARTSFRNAAQQNQPLYFVTGIQTASATSPKASTETTRVRRVDSASSLSPRNTKDVAVTAVQVRRVRCFISTPSEPHSVEDLGYEWSYHVLEDERQLCVGLERFETSKRGVGLAEKDEMVCGEEGAEPGWDQERYDDEGEIGGF